MGSTRSRGSKESKARRRDRLDPLTDQKKRFADDQGIEDLPELPTIEVQPRQRALDTARKCDKCGKEGRVVSNRNGVRAYCVCGFNWGISLMALQPSLPLTGGRGISKETLVEPDWSLADEDLDAEEHFVRTKDKDET